jgi:hypothetical protein
VTRFDLADPEYLPVQYLDRAGNNTVSVSAILDAGYCATLTLPWAGLAIDPELWRDCLNTPFDTTNLTAFRGGYSWQSENLLLFGDRPKRTFNISSFDLTSGISTRLVENGRFPDAGQ